jgi:hypothetical protein
MPVFNDNPPYKKRRLRLGYGTAVKARRSIRLLRKQSRQYQVLTAHTMYSRAKYHKHQTEGMREAAKVYRKFIQTLKQKGLRPMRRKTHKRT